MTTYTPKFSAPFLNMEQLCKETGIAYKSLEAFVSNRKKQGIDVVNIDNIKYSVIPGRLKINYRTYIWNTQVFYEHWILPTSQQQINSDRPLQVKSGNTVYYLNQKRSN